MTFAALAALREGLDTLAREGLHRERRVIATAQGPRLRIGGADLVNFASNDYLGLANHPLIREAAIRAIDAYGLGAGASPLVVGHTEAHERAEIAFARFVGAPRALLFASGYAANLGILSALVDREGEVFADRLNHACLNDGAILSRATLRRYPHGDLDRLESLLKSSVARTRLIATDAVFSMDGDVADVTRLLELAERFDAWLVLDDAHGIGVLGRGRGTPAQAGIRSSRIIHMATLGKALGGYGAFVAADADVIEWLLQRARTYVFSTALPASVAAAATAAIDLVEGEPGLVDRLHRRIAEFRHRCSEQGIATTSITAIHPIVVGNPMRALDLSERLRTHGQLVPAIRPPTVPDGTARLRVSLSAAHTSDDVAQLVGALADGLRGNSG